MEQGVHESCNIQQAGQVHRPVQQTGAVMSKASEGGPASLHVSHAAARIGRCDGTPLDHVTKQASGTQALMEQDAGFVQPAARRNEVLGWVKEGLRDFSISRAAVAWGIPIPQDPAQTVYVWFDALLGYMSGEKPFQTGRSCKSVG